MSYFIWLAVLAGGSALFLIGKEWLRRADKSGEDFKDEWETLEKTLDETNK